MTTILYTHPGTCGRVTAIALEECGVDYAMEPVRFASGEHRSEVHRKRNPLGKVPALEIDGQFLHETVAILTYLDEIHPGARLLPTVTGRLEKARQLADLCLCSATLHPIVTRIAIPSMFGPPEAGDAIRSAAKTMMERFLEIVEARMAANGSWYAEGWSMMDAYLSWIWWRITGAGFDGSAFPALAAAMQRTGERASVRRALARESELAERLKAEGAAFDIKTVTPATAA